MKSIRIGIFDSGIGGLNVLKLLQAKYPNFKYIYLADNKNLPYGDKEPWQIIEFSRRIIEFLISQQVDMIVVPCNTSSAISIDLLRPYFSVPIIDIITPVVEQTANLFKNIAVIATQGTVTSNMYKKKFQSINKNINVIQIACPKLVPLIESGKIENKETLKILEDYLDPILKNLSIEALIYGCTHYQYLDKQIKYVLDSDKSSSYRAPGFNLTRRKKPFILDPSDFIITAVKEKLLEKFQRYLIEANEIELSEEGVVAQFENSQESNYVNSVNSTPEYPHVQYLATADLHKGVKHYEQFSHLDL